MGIAAVSIVHCSSLSHCSAKVAAVEVEELKLNFATRAQLQLLDEDNAELSSDTVRYLCGSGLAHVRRRLRLNGGLSVSIEELSGVVSKDGEAVAILAVAIAVAKAIGRSDYKSLLDDPGEWEVDLKV